MYGLRMKRIAQRMISPRGRSARTEVRRTRPQIEALEARLVLSSSSNNLYLQTNLVSDIQGMAQLTDPNLKDPWGLSFSTGSPFWISDQASNFTNLSTGNSSPVSTLYNSSGSGSLPSLIVNIPNQSNAPADSTANGPTGQVSTGALGITTNANDFPVVGPNGGPSHEASFIFANMDGSISAWAGGNSGKPIANTTATIEANVAGTSFTGLAIANNPATAVNGASGVQIYAADQNSGNIDVFNSQWKMTAQLTDPNGLPAGFNAFNVQTLNGLLYVTYTNQSIPSGGIVDVFKPDGTFDGRLINDPTGKWLDNPWGLTIAPQSFGKFGGDLLVGNNGGNNWINAFDPMMNNDFEGTLTLGSGHPFSENNLWALSFGNGGGAGSTNTLFFTAGPGGTDGLFGSLQAIPSLSAKAPIVPNLPNGALQTVTTVPANGDQNPYGVAFVPPGFPSGGTLSPGDILVSNFNNSGNTQGTGTTIVRITPQGQVSTFFTSTSTGLDTALAVLKSGFVIVGNVPTTDGTFGTIKQGSLQILNSSGTVVKTLTDSTFLAEPWDLAVNDQGDRVQVFVSNLSTVQGDTGTVTRLDLTISPSGTITVGKPVQIASGYNVQANTAAVVLGPTGLAFDAKKNVLYVASTGDNEIFAIPNAATRTSDDGKGSVVYQDNAHLRGPLGLVLAPNGDLITANGDAVNPDPTQNSELVEFTPGGKFVGEFSLDPNPGGAFGLAVTNAGRELRLAAVDDNTNSLDVWTFNTRDGSSKSTGAFSVGAAQPSGENAAAVDQLLLAIQEEDLHSALFGPPDGVGGPKKDPTDPWSV